LWAIGVKEKKLPRTGGKSHERSKIISAGERKRVVAV